MGSAAAPRAAALLGLGFGDCGKGLFTDYLCRQWPVHSVVRFNGGAQAGHNVVLPDGRHHTFSQFGAGSFVPGVATVLAQPVVLHPTALLVENDALQQAGVTDALARLLIDARCRITTPFHQAAGRLRELARGEFAHGTCGAGVGETVRHALLHPGEALHYGDLARPDILTRLETIRQRLRGEFSATQPNRSDAAWQAEMRMLDDAVVGPRWLDSALDLVRRAAPATAAAISELLRRPGTVLFEGAQGVLLDEWRGFHPHTTWSTIHSTAVEQVAAGYGLAERIMHLGVLRSYLTRHGPGPLPTHDPNLDNLAEPHNSGAGWQGPFRRGHPDALLLQYALATVGRLDGLLVSHLDAFERAGGLQWCTSYDAPAAAEDAALCTRNTLDRAVTRLLPAVGGADLAHQARLTRLLESARPRYANRPITSPAAYLESLSALTAYRPLFGSHGPTHEMVRRLAAPG